MRWADYNAGELLWLGEWSMPWVVLLLTLGVVVVVISAIDLRPLSRGRRWTLVGLRTMVYLLAVAMLLEPAIDLRNVSRVRNNVPVLVDVSKSMTLPGASRTRYEAALQAVDRLEIPPERVTEDHSFSFFRFGESAEMVPLEVLSQHAPADETTDLAVALETIQERFRGSDLGGIVIVSDGIDLGSIGKRVRHDEDLDHVTLELLRSFQAPIHTVAVATEEELRDIAIRKVSREDFAFVHNRVSVEVDILAVGVEPKKIPVNLYRGRELLQSREISIQTGTRDYRVAFEFVPQRIGKEIYRVEIPELVDEALYENNVSHFVQKVIRDKIRVLQVVGRPSWDERFLRRHLKENPNVDLISFFILRTNANVELAPNHELSLIPFPTDELFRDEIRSFDLVIFQNFDFGPYQMRQYLPNIADFVREGGGFVMIGGDLSFASGGYAQTPIEEILPVRLPPRSATTLVDEGRFRPVLTESGRRHPITQLAFDPDVNQEIWSRLPMQSGTNLVMEARSSATVLASHPHLSAAGAPMPVITVMEVGKGRTMSLTTDDTWRWSIENVGHGGSAREYQAFWNSAIRWLIQDPDLKLLKVEFERDQASPGEEASLTIRAFESDYTPSALIQGTLDIHFATLDRLEDSGVIQTLAFETDGSGVFRTQVQLEQPGVYVVEASVEGSAGELRDQDLVLVVDDVEEFRNILPHNRLLEQIAKATEGQYFEGPQHVHPPEFLPSRVVEVHRRRVIHLWDSMLLFGLIIGLLGTEWWLRRIWGRL